MFLRDLALKRIIVSEGTAVKQCKGLRTYHCSVEFSRKHAEMTRRLYLITGLFPCSLEHLQFRLRS